MALPQPVVPKPVARSAGAAALVALLMILFGVAAPVAAAAPAEVPSAYVRLAHLEPQVKRDSTGAGTVPTGGADTGLGGAAGPGSVPLANAAGVLIGWGFLLVVAMIGLLFATCFVR